MMDLCCVGGPYQSRFIRLCPVQTSAVVGAGLNKQLYMVEAYTGPRGRFSYLRYNCMAKTDAEVIIKRSWNNLPKGEAID